MSGLYNAGREAFGDGRLSWTRDKIVAQLVSGAYLFNPAHADRRDITGQVGAAVAVAGRSIPAGWARGQNLVFPQVKGDDIVGIIFRREAEQENRNTLIAYVDGIEGFPMKTNGGDILIELPQHPGIFRI